jgi:hypothetical protein
MNRTEFKLENLKALDFGLIGAAFDAELQHVVKDCQERPMDEAARKVTISFNLVPVPEHNSNTGAVDLNEVRVECEITSAVPKRRTKVYTMKPTNENRLAFHPDLPEEPDESALYDEDVRKREAKKQ